LIRIDTQTVTTDSYLERTNDFYGMRLFTSAESLHESVPDYSTIYRLYTLIVQKVMLQLCYRGVSMSYLYIIVL